MWAKLKKQLWQWRGVLVTVPSTATILIGLRCMGLLQPLDFAALDLFFVLRPIEPVDERIVIVEVNEQDVQKLNWPISDAKLAKMLSIIKENKPRVIGLDIYRDLPVEPGHSDLVKIFESTPNLIGIKKIVSENSGFSVNPPPTLADLGQVAANDFVVDPDGRIRRNLLSLKDNKGELVLSLGADLALRYLEELGISLEILDPNTNKMKLGKAIFHPFQANDGGYVGALTGGYQILSNFPNRGYQIFSNLPNRRSQYRVISNRTISISEVLEGQIPKNLLRDRIVLIGITAESHPDYFYTSLSNQLFTDKPIRFSGVSIHADIASQLISSALEGRAQIKVWSDPWEWLWIFTWSAVGATLTWTRRYRKENQIPLTAISILLLGSILVVGSYFALLSGWWIPVAPGFLALFGSAAIITVYVAHSTSQMRQTFGRYLTDEVVANLLETPEGLKLGGEKRIVTVLISDLRGFSALSEGVSPDKIVEIINLYLEKMTNVVNDYKGTINDFMGDGILVMFGAPIAREDDSERAVACAVAMQLAMDSINSKLAEINLPPLGMGIGIHTGEVLAGNIGSQQRAKYTVMGNNVNLASRIESYSVGGQILISEDTLKSIHSIARVDGQMEVQPKGIHEPFTIYQIGGIHGKYNLFLPQKEEIFITLQQEIALEYKVSEGKHLGEEILYGSLIKLSLTSAEIYSKQAVELLSNLQIHFLSPGDETGALQNIYAKVVEIYNEDKTRFFVKFTALPSEFKDFFDSLL
jgi:adenylate cyclase